MTAPGQKATPFEPVQSVCCRGLRRAYDALAADFLDSHGRLPQPRRFAELLAFEAFGDGGNFDMSDDNIREELDMHAVPPS